MSKHTPGPWHVGGKDASTIYDEFSQRIANSFEGVMATQRTDAQCAANARRIVVCVNACEGLDLDMLERFGLGTAIGHDIYRVTKQRDELLAALLAALKACASALEVVSPGGDTDPDVVRARAAIAKAKGV